MTNLTADEIDKLDGRELDALVASEVMRLSQVGYYRRKSEYNAEWESRQKDDREVAFGNNPVGLYFLRAGWDFPDGLYSVPLYTTNWNAMQEVVYQFRFGGHKQANGGCPVACAVKLKFSDDAVYPDCYCEILSPSLAPVSAFSYSSMPLAVARCALKVVMVNPDEQPHG